MRPTELWSSGEFRVNWHLETTPPVVLTILSCHVLRVEEGAEVAGCPAVYTFADDLRRFRMTL